MKGIRALLLLAALFPVPAHSFVFDEIFAFGDSLSDNGNTFAATAAAQPSPIPIIPPSPPYFEGRFSNGPVAVEYLASLRGAVLHDMAWGGATTGIGNTNDGGTVSSFGLLNLPGVATQIANFSASPPSIEANDLFVLWAGPNDFLAGNFSDPVAAVNTGVTNLAGSLATLATLGAAHVLVPNMTDLSLTPSARAQAAALSGTGGPASGALFLQSLRALSIAFNAGLASALETLEGAFPATAFIPADVFATFNAAVADPAAFGFTNVTDRCLSVDLMSVCASLQAFLFWDGIHPTTQAHAVLAGLFNTALNAALPEPSTILLIAIGFGALVWVRARKPANWR